MKTKTCSNLNCSQKNPQPVSEFSKNDRYKDGLFSWCKTCTREVSRKCSKRRYYKDTSYQQHLRQLKKPPFYGAWIGMKSRCFNPNATGYSNYGGRGITVCEEWKDSFETWYNYVSKLKHFREKGRTLDRINNDGNYEPGNVRWATKKEQARNRRCIIRRSRTSKTLS